MSHHPSRRLLARRGLAAALVTGLGISGAALGVGVPASAGPRADQDRSHQPASRQASSDGPRAPKKVPTSRGHGGAVSSVDPYATRVGLRVLRRGGNAVDAAVATAAALGVTEPYSAGLGGGGYFVYYDAKSKRVRTIDGRETAPQDMPHDAFINPKTKKPYNFTPELVTSGVSVGVPGTPATWEKALDRWGTLSLDDALTPAARLARRGFVVDETFRQQTLDNQERFEAYTTTPELFLPDGDAPEVGSVFRNPDLARTYRMLGQRGMDAFYEGDIAREISDLVQDPPKSPETELPVMPGYMKPGDLADYRAKFQKPTRMRYRGLDVFGMAPSSSGGSTVGEALNIMERFRLDRRSTPAALHRYLESTALAFADRGAYLGDQAYVDVPLRDLLSDRFAAERACLIKPHRALKKPVAAGDVDDYDGRCGDNAKRTGSREDHENVETTNLVVADKWGNVVAYTLTIEQTGGSGMLVPDRGFLLNNELTDFSLTYDEDDPNRIEGGKRPRSSMSPTIVLRGKRPFLALGSPGGSTIITTVTQMLFNRIDRDMGIAEALAAPRASQRNTAEITAEPAFVDRWGPALERYGHVFAEAGDAFTSAPEIGAATAIEMHGRGRMVAAAEPERRGGGTALVVREHRRGRGR